jgi:DNA-binding MarR family transcriptional regulator/ribosomal protein S18 acetylase RimI-like enzyme
MFSGSRPEHIAAVREFNRFYTARLGLLRKRHLDGEFSLTEARVLYEIGAAPNVTASTLHNTLDLDPGYLSRLLALMMRRKLVRHKTSRADGREKLLSLSSLGERKLDDLNHQSALQIHGVIDSLSEGDRETVVSSLSRVQSILSRAQRTPIQIVQLAKETQDAQAILQEYYETVNVLVRDKPGAIQAIIDAPASGIWLAYLGKEVVGCVVLRRLESIAKSSECKRLYVKPWARGRGIADKLLDAQEMHARKEGLEWIYLDSYDDLKAAIALYEKRGYERCERYNDNPQATVFMRKKIVGSNRRLLQANTTKDADPGTGESEE